MHRFLQRPRQQVFIAKYIRTSLTARTRAVVRVWKNSLPGKEKKKWKKMRETNTEMRTEDGKQYWSCKSPAVPVVQAETATILRLATLCSRTGGIDGFTL